MSNNKWQAVGLMVLIALPLIIYFFFRYTTTTVFNKIPYQYSISPQGDTLYHSLPEFTLTDQDGNTITRQTTENQVYVINFINTRDRKYMPLVIDNMRKVYQNINETNLVHILSITTNPQHDSVAVLRSLADSLEVDTRIWSFATGEREQVLALGLDAFRMKEFMGKQRTTEAFGAHACALVDKEGRVRKYYDASHLYDVEKLLTEDMRALLTLEYREDFKEE